MLTLLCSTAPSGDDMRNSSTRFAVACNLACCAGSQDVCTTEPIHVQIGPATHVKHSRHWIFRFVFFLAHLPTSRTLFVMSCRCLLWDLFCSTIKHRSNVCKQRRRHGPRSTDVRRAHNFQLTHDQARSVSGGPCVSHTQALVRMSVNTIPARTQMHASIHTDSAE